MQIGEVARKMSQFDLDLKQNRDVVKGEQDQQGEKISEIATISNRGLCNPSMGLDTAYIQEPGMMPIRGLAQLPWGKSARGKSYYPTKIGGEYLG